MGLTYRPATPGDVDAIRRVGHATWPATYAFAGEDYVRDGLERWWSREAMLESMERTVWMVAEECDDEGCLVVGIGNLDLRPDPPLVAGIYVRPDRQNDRIGERIMSELVALVPPEHAAVRLEFVEGNDRAAGFCARQGFSEVHRETGSKPGWPESVWLERPVG